MNDKDLREAMSRREARRQQPQPSADFCDSVMQRINQQNEQPKRRRVWLYPAIGIAAAIVLLFSVGGILNRQDIEKPTLVAQTDTMKVNPQTKPPKREEQPVKKVENKEMADTVKKVKEILQMPRPPKHYMAKAEPTESTPEPEVVDEIELMERAIAEETRRMEMEMMAQTGGSLQADFKAITDEIRQRGERMTQQVEIALSDDE